MRATLLREPFILNLSKGRADTKEEPVILEMAVLDIKPGQSQAFEKAMTKARPLIEASEGFQRMEVRPCIETENRYLLLVCWDSLEAHSIGFRQSERYEKWRAALHHFYEPFPTVEHYGEAL